MLSWRFYIRNNDISGGWEEVDEPIGWDGDELILSRSPNYEGLENYKSTELEFYNHVFNGLDKIRAGYTARGYDANFDIKIDAYCNDELTDSIVGYLNFLTYQYEGNTVKLDFEESSFSRSFKSRIDTIINLDSNTGIDGGALTDITRKTVKLHSKEIQLFVESENSSLYDKDTFEYLSASPAQSPPYQFWDDEEHTIPSGSDDCETKSNTFYLQIAPDTAVVQDSGLVTQYGIPSGITKLENPWGRVEVAGDLEFQLDIEACMFIWANTQGGVTAKLCDCGDEFDSDNFLIDTFNFQIEVVVGAQTQSDTISSYSRSVCSEEFFGDLVGKNEEYMAEVGVTMTDTFSRPFNSDEQRRWNKKNRFVQITRGISFSNVNVGDDIYIRLKCFVTGDFEQRVSDTTVQYICEGYLGENTTISINSRTTTPPSETEGYLVYEALNRISESITGRTDAIRSEYFGRTDSVPKTYDVTGCEALNLYTNGKNLRNLVDGDGVKYPIYMSFADLFNDLSQKRCLGFKVERTGGLDYVRIEPIEYFYTNDSFMTFSNVSGIREEVAIQRLYNDFEIGYNRWEIENLNGIDEFNTKHTYSIPSRNIKQKLQATTNYIAGGYAIEMTRRMQATDNPTTDWKYDDENFCISLNRIQVTTDVYEGTSQTYEPGEVSERSELYDSVVNVISPDTAYNLRFSPAECAMFWFKKLAPALLLKDEQALKFQSGTGNILLAKTRSVEDDCSIIQSTLQENQDIDATASTFLDLSRIALFQPTWIYFENPLSYNEFITIRENSNRSISVTCGGRSYSGFIEQVKYKPNIEGGKADFKLLVTFCYEGEFNNDFNNDFNVGTC